MIDAAILGQLMANSFYIVAPVAVGLTQLFKVFFLEEDWKKFSPHICVLLATIVELVYAGLSGTAAIAGICIGLASTGMWTTVVSPWKKEEVV